MSYQSDSVRSITLSSILVPLKEPISDAKVITGRQKPLRGVDLLVAEIATDQGLTGLGFTYSLRAGGTAQYVHAKEVAEAAIGEDPNDIAKLYSKLLWAGASVGRSGLATQALAAIDIALYDLKSKRANLPLAKFLGSYRDSVRAYNTSGGYLSSTLDEVKHAASQSIERGIGGIKIKVGLPDHQQDIRKIEALREHIGDTPLMVDVNQQWDRTTALRMGRVLDDFGLTWIEEPLDAHDVEGHRRLTRTLDTPIATGEMLSSVTDLKEYITAKACDIVQPDAPRLGGISQYLRLMTFADEAGLDIAPHFVMEIHAHLAACYPRETWVEHFDWLEPVFDERLEIKDGRMMIPDRPGLGLSLSERARGWCVESTVVGS